jgi:predicted DCC family thiol-disulfide oxidoreductase YuxK
MRNRGLDTLPDAADPGIARRSPSQSPQIERTNPASTDMPGDRSAKPAPQKSWRLPLLILGPVAVVVGALVIYLATGRYVTEEDAYVQAVNVSISPQVAGQVLAIAAKSNTAVTKNDPLFNLDPEPYRIALANAEAQLGIARDQANTLIETYRSRLKQIDEARATLDYAQYDRQQHLFDTGAAPRSTLDAAIRDLQTAKANLASLQREAAAALAQLGGNPDLPVDQQATVKQAQAAVDTAARNLRLTSIVARSTAFPIMSRASRSEPFSMPANPRFRWYRRTISTLRPTSRRQSSPMSGKEIRRRSPSTPIRTTPSPPGSRRWRPPEARYSRCCRRKMPQATGSRWCSASRCGFPSARSGTALRCAPA